MFDLLLKRLRMVLKSKEVFNNWLSSVLRYIILSPYLLYERYPRLSRSFGKKCINVVCKDGNTVCIDSALYGHVIRSNYFGFIREFKCDYKSNALIINGLMVKPSADKYFDIGPARFKQFQATILEVFVGQVYSLVDVKGKEVVDIGASIGDSAIYFVLKGAKKVYAVEPHPIAYNEMLDNIKLNNMYDRITPINAAIGSKPGFIFIETIACANDIATIYYGTNSNSGSFKVPVITLDQLVKEYNIKPDVLKMDCEGCEYDMILNDYEHVRMFKELIFEYHEMNGRKVIELLNKLCHDYKCNKIEMTTKTGILYCTKS